MRLAACTGPRCIGAACLVLVAVVWGLTFQRIHFEREDDIREAIRQNENLAIALEEQTVRTLKVVDQALHLLSLAFVNEDGRIPDGLIRSLGPLDRKTYSFLGVADAAGNVLLGTGVVKPFNVADRDYFAYHRDHVDAGLRIGAPALGRSTGRKEIQVTRRISRADGSFAGVALAGIDPNYFSRLYEQVALGPAGLIQLVGLDGTSFARNIEGSMVAGADMRASTLLRLAALQDKGSYLSRGFLDGVQRHTSFRALREHGLVVSVGIARDHVLKTAQEREQWYLLGAAVATLLTALFGGGMVVSLRRQQLAMEAALASAAERKKVERLIEHQTHYDALTGLPNRELLFDRLAQTLKHARRKEGTVGLLYIDLDRFKNVNDTLGHENGDQLLRAAAQRIATAVRGEDTVGRLAGDEFVLVLAELASANDAARVAKKVIDAMAAPFGIAEHEIFVTASVGITVSPEDGLLPEILINNANAAMQRAKQTGRNNFQFYTSTLNERSAEKLLLESDLRRALERGEFVLHFQPKVDVLTGALEGFEALLRWQKADGSIVPPGLFVPLLEESGLIAGVGEWVIRAACSQLREWERAGLAPVPIAVNVSASQFLRSDLPALIDAAVRKLGVDARLLEIEITESDIMQDPDRVIAVLRALGERGVRAAIDDFGTGYSSLAYLAKLPIAALKIDRSFIQRMQSEPNDLTLVSTMISLAHSLRLKVIAEGVENEEQAKLLRLLRCDQNQGYFYSRPVPAADCKALLAHARPRQRAA